MDDQVQDVTITESPRLFTPKVGIALLLACLVGGSVGFILGQNNNSRNSSLNSADIQNAYDNGYEAARERLAEQGFLLEDELSSTTDQTSVRGVVKSISDDKVKVQVLPNNPLEDSWELTANLTSDSKYFSLHSKPLEEFNAEMEAYIELVDGTDVEGVDLPPPFTREKITIADINIDDMVRINTLDNISPTSENKIISIEVESLGEIIMNNEQEDV